VDKSEAKKIFLEADALFDRGEFDASLHLLQRLNREFPRQKHIMYSAALCLEQLGRAQECIGLCEQLIARFQDERAELILSRLAGLENVEEPLLSSDGSRRLNHEDHRLIAMLMDPDSVSPLPAQQGQTRALLYGLGFVAFLVLFLLFAGGFLYFTPGDGADTAGREEGFNVGQILVLFFATAFAANLATMYTLLHLMRRLRYEEPLDNAFDVIQYAFYVSLLLLLPVLGWIYIPILIRRHFGLQVGELVLFLVFQTVLTIGFSLIFGAILVAFGYGWDFSRWNELAG
jgi:tetratricopeptide (TPR) repeat protein